MRGGQDIFVIKRYASEEGKEKRMLAISKPKASPTFTEGEKFTSFDIRTINGIKIKKEELAEKILVFNFLSLNSPLCRKEMRN